jgi:Fe-S-cluster containining protein
MAEPDAAPFSRDTPFSYTCNACGRCCQHKGIQVNPYEVARLAANRGVDSATLIARYLRPDAPQLRQHDDGFCIFFSADGGCGVHPDRPLVCRLYPLGRVVDWEGGEHYRTLDPHPETEGVYGTDGRVADYIASQGAAPFMQAADAYYALVRDLLTALAGADPDASPPEAPGADVQQMGPAGTAAPGTVDPAWLDIDGNVAAYCAATGREVPDNPEDKMRLHIASVRAMLDGDPA